MIAQHLMSELKLRPPKLQSISASCALRCAVCEKPRPPKTIVRWQLIHDLEVVFLDDRIGEHFLGNSLELLLRFVTAPAIQIEHEEFALANVGNLRVTQAGKSMLNSLTLRVQNSAFRHNPDVSFHGR